jgi:hypothetical protein
VYDCQKINTPRIPTTDDATEKSTPISSNP